MISRVDTHMFGPPGKCDCAPGLWNEGNKHRTKMNENFKLPEIVRDDFGSIYDVIRSVPASQLQPMWRTIHRCHWLTGYKIKSTKATSDQTMSEQPQVTTEHSVEHRHLSKKICRSALQRRPENNELIISSFSPGGESTSLFIIKNYVRCISL